MSLNLRENRKENIFYSSASNVFVEQRVISFYGKRSMKKTNGLSAVETVKSEHRVSNQITIWIVENLVIFHNEKRCLQKNEKKIQRTIRNFNKNGHCEKKNLTKPE